MDQSQIISSFVALFVIIDPIGLAPLFVALTKGMTSSHRRAIAIRACLIAFGLLLMFGLMGEAVLQFMGISMPAFRIAGGILLFLTALEMLFERRTQRRRNQASAADDPSVFPLATPLVAGPGAITTVILLTDKASGSFARELIVFAVLLAVIGLVLLAFFMAGLFERALGATGTNVVTRLLGMLLAALSVQFVVDGISALITAGT